MKSIKTVVLIGAGNVATRLGIQFKSIGLDVICVYSRTVSNAINLSETLETNYVSDIQSIPRQADLYLLAIKDASIVDFVNQFTPKSGIIVHTSGSISMNVFQKLNRNYGVFYPLQTFSKDVYVNLADTPFLIEGDSTNTVNLLIDLAKKISYNIFEVDSEKRKKIHLSAVWINNFTNFMLIQAESLMKNQQLPFSIFEPLAKETIRKAFEYGAMENQTGPAKRNDVETINNHIDILNHQGKSNMADLYKILSEYIIKEYKL